MRAKTLAFAVLALVLAGCSADEFPVMVECHRPDGLLAFYGPARGVRFQMVGYRGDPALIVDDGRGILREFTYIPADCTCVATERVSK